MKIRTIEFRCDACSKKIAEGESTREAVRKARDAGAATMQKKMTCKSCRKAKV